MKTSFNLDSKKTKAVTVKPAKGMIKSGRKSLDSEFQSLSSLFNYLRKNNSEALLQVTKELLGNDENFQKFSEHLQESENFEDTVETLPIKKQIAINSYMFIISNGLYKVFLAFATNNTKGESKKTVPKKPSSAIVSMKAHLNKIARNAIKTGGTIEINENSIRKFAEI